MDLEIELDLVSGDRAKLTLPEPGNFTSFYVFSMEHSGNIEFWQLLVGLMAAEGRSIFAFHEGSGKQSLNHWQFTRSGMRDLLRRHGYGFGILFDADPGLTDILVAESQKLLFLRDPREMLAASYCYLIRQADMTAASAATERADHSATSARPSFTEFLQSPDVERVAQRYRRFGELWRQEGNATLFRYEHALSGWHAIAAEIVAKLKLPIDPLTAASIAANSPSIGDQLQVLDRQLASNSTTAANGLSRNEIADLEVRFADVLAVFGYAPRSNRAYWPGPLPAGDDAKDVLQAHSGGSQVLSAAEGVRRGPIRPRLGAIFEPDPVLLNRNRPNSSAEMHVLGRRVIMDVDATGCRPVIGQPPEGEKTLAAYGCSFTYGIAITAEETFCSLLQGMFPTWRVENHGVSAYSTSRNLIQLERETRWNKPELVTFCWIEHHLVRNVADITWVQTTTEYIPRPATGEAPERRIPRAVLDPDGVLQMRSVRLPRYDLIGIDFSDFAPDRYYLDLVCFRLFERASAIVTGYGGHFFVTTLQGQLSAGLAGRLAESGIPVVDASLNGDEYLCLPDDAHANALANRIYAERIRDYLLRYTAWGCDTSPIV